LSNLIGKTTKSCGCKGYEERTLYPWRCKETGEIIPSTKALALRLGINPLGLYRQLYKGNTVIQDGDEHWECLLDVGIQGTNVARAYLNEETGEVRVGAKAMQLLCGIPTHQINHIARTKGCLTAIDGSIWKVIDA
jgi:hypothetical protein